MHDKFRLAQAQQQFARLMGLCEQQAKELRENPEPFLAKASAEVGRHRRLLSEVRAALTGLDEFLQGPQQEIQYESTASMLMRRQKKALELIRTASGESDG